MDFNKEIRSSLFGCTSTPPVIYDLIVMARVRSNRKGLKETLYQNRGILVLRTRIFDLEQGIFGLQQETLVVNREILNRKSLNSKSSCDFSKFLPNNNNNNLNHKVCFTKLRNNSWRKKLYIIRVNQFKPIKLFP